MKSNFDKWLFVRVVRKNGNVVTRRFPIGDEGRVARGWLKRHPREMDRRRYLVDPTHIEECAQDLATSMQGKLVDYKVYDGFSA